jgi:hypothetical protein
MRFEESAVYPDEEVWAIRIYEEEIRERELWRYT